MNFKPCVAMLIGALLLGSCVVYEPVPVPQPSLQERYDRSWSAAAGAMSDEGLTITQQDRGSGVIVGTRGNTTIVATVQTLADGRIQVRFDSRGATAADPDLIHRVSDSYDRRMGR
jgi:hypothetical protein